MKAKRYLGQSLEIMKKDKYIQLFSLFPVLIGIMLYIFIGQWFFNDLYVMGSNYITEKVGEGSFASFFGYILIAFLSVGFYFTINWGFFMLVSIVASPFNDLISERVEKAIKGNIEPLGDSISRMMKNIVFLLLHQLKKILFFAFLGLIGFVLSFFIPPLSILISAILLAASFLDYSWERKLFSFSRSIDDLRKNFFSYGIAGGIFLLLISIPIINLLMIPLGVVYFTVIFIEKNPQ